MPNKTLKELYIEAYKIAKKKEGQILEDELKIIHELNIRKKEPIKEK